MGYLLPIQFTQYQEYQNRIKGVKSNYRETTKVERIKRVYRSQKECAADGKAYADFMGIGSNFDEKI